MHQQDIQAGGYYLMDVRSVLEGQSILWTHLVMAEAIDSGRVTLVDTMGHGDWEMDLESMVSSGDLMPVSPDLAYAIKAAMHTHKLQDIWKMSREASAEVQGHVTAD